MLIFCFFSFGDFLWWAHRLSLGLAPRTRWFGLRPGKHIVLFGRLRKNPAFFPRTLWSPEFEALELRQMKGFCCLAVSEGGRVSAFGSPVSWLWTLGRFLMVAELLWMNVLSCLFCTMRVQEARFSHRVTIMYQKSSRIRSQKSRKGDPLSVVVELPYLFG